MTDLRHRSDQMPPPSQTILPHARSVNNITLSHLLRPSTKSISLSQQSSSQSSDTSNSMVKFLTNSLSGIPTKTAISIVSTLRLQHTSPPELTSSQVGGILTLKTYFNRRQLSAKSFVMNQQSARLLRLVSAPQVPSPFPSLSLKFLPQESTICDLVLLKKSNRNSLPPTLTNPE